MNRILVAQQFGLMLLYVPMIAYMAGCKTILEMMQND